MGYGYLWVLLILDISYLKTDCETNNVKLKGVPQFIVSCKKQFTYVYSYINKY